jgi:hypothetical protein
VTADAETFTQFQVGREPFADSRIAGGYFRRKKLAQFFVPDHSVSPPNRAERPIRSGHFRVDIECKSK